GMLLVSVTASGAVRAAAVDGDAANASPLWFSTLDQKAAVLGDDKLTVARAEARAGDWEGAAKSYEGALMAADPRVRASAVVGYEEARAVTRTWWWEVGKFLPTLRWSIIHPWRAFWFATFIFVVLPFTLWALSKIRFFALVRWTIKKAL